MPYDLEKFRKENAAYGNSSLREIANDLFNYHKSSFESMGIRSVDDWADNEGLREQWDADDARIADERQQAEMQQQIQSRGTAGSLASSVTRGVYGAGEMGLRAYRALPGGPELGDDSRTSNLLRQMEEYRQETPFLQAKQTGGLGDTVREGVEASATSLTTAGIGAGVGAALGPIGAGAGALVGAGVGFIAGAPLFGLAEYDSFVEEGMNSEKFKRGDVTRDQIEAGAIKSGLYEGTFEFGANFLQVGLMLGMGPIGALLSQGAKQAAKQGFKAILKGGILKGTGKRMAVVGLTEVPSEMATAAFQSGEYNLITDEEQNWFDAAKQAMGPSMVASLIFGAFADAGFRSRVNRHAKVLANPNADPRQRIESVEAVGKELDTAAPQYATEWRQNAFEAVRNGKPVSEKIANNAELTAEGEGTGPKPDSLDSTIDKTGADFDEDPMGAVDKIDIEAIDFKRPELSQETIEPQDFRGGRPAQETIEPQPFEKPEPTPEATREMIEPTEFKKAVPAEPAPKGPPTKDELNKVFGDLSEKLYKDKSKQPTREDLQRVFGEVSDKYYGKGLQETVTGEPVKEKPLVEPEGKITKEVEKPSEQPTKKSKVISKLIGKPEEVGKVKAKEPWEMTGREFFDDETGGGWLSQTKASRNLTLKRHGKIVEQALSEGKPVLPEVLKDYPDLQHKYRPEAEKQREADQVAQTKKDLAALKTAAKETLPDISKYNLKNIKVDVLRRSTKDPAKAVVFKMPAGKAAAEINDRKTKYEKVMECLAGGSI